MDRQISKAGRPHKYTSMEEANEKHRQQKRAWQIQHRAEHKQLVGLMSNSQAEIIQYLTHNVIQNEPLLQAFLHRIQSRICLKNEGVFLL